MNLLLVAAMVAAVEEVQDSVFGAVVDVDVDVYCEDAFVMLFFL